MHKECLQKVQIFEKNKSPVSDTITILIMFHIIFVQ